MGTSMTTPNELQQRLRQYGQEHVLRHWEQLSLTEQTALMEQVLALDLHRLQQLYSHQDRTYPVPGPEQIQPVPVAGPSPEEDHFRQLGGEALRAGQVAALLVAGGQGSRLGFEHPKGMFPVGPVTRKTLFQIHAEKVLALQKRYHCPLPLLVMTSPATDAETRQFFAQHDNFGLAKEDVHFFTQATMPALDLATGKLLMDAPGRLFLSPNGHGGTLTALNKSGLLAMMEQRDIEHIFYFQVDNPLVKIADPVFLGRHLAARAEVSSKVIPKLGPTDKLGNFVQVDGRCTMIEYSDLPEQLARQTDASGKLLLWAGNPAIHLFDRRFLERMTHGEGQMPFHLARKKVPYLDDSGQLVQPAKENALKFELFIFDVLPLAERWILVETSRGEEFAPLKNASGADSPAAVEKALTDLTVDWLTCAGAPVPAPTTPDAPLALEVSPLFALDAEEFAQRLQERGYAATTRYFGD